MVDCLFFRFLEWLIPRDQLDFVDDERADGETVFDRFVLCFAYRRNLFTELPQTAEVILPSLLIPASGREAKEEFVVGVSLRFILSVVSASVEDKYPNP